MRRFDLLQVKHEHAVDAMPTDTNSITLPARFPAE
jgi:hypothetical protein